MKTSEAQSSGTNQLPNNKIRQTQSTECNNAYCIKILLKQRNFRQYKLYKEKNTDKRIKGGENRAENAGDTEQRQS